MEGKILKIALLAPIKRPITPITTASRNRVIADLASGLVSRGHKVTIFATSDSFLPEVEIVGTIPQGLNFLPTSENPFYQHTAYLVKMIKTFLSRQSEFDLVHNHMYPEFLPFLSLDSIKIPMVTTVHAQMTDELSMALSLFPEVKLVAISNAAKKSANLPMEVVYNGIDTDFFVPNPKSKKDYLLFIGRMSKARDKDGNFIDPKGVQNAIKITELTGEKLKIIGNVEDMEFFEKLVKPYLNDRIEFVGEISPEQTLSREEIRNLYVQAKAFLYPINWEEPFGLVMAEALSCGAPVVAFDRGAVSEIVCDGKTGFVIDYHSGVEGIVDALQKVDRIDRGYCRGYAVAHFSRERMVSDYEKIYCRLLA